MVALVALWTVKFIPITSIGFPIVLLAICGLRKLLSYIFTTWELRVLDDLLPEQAVEADSDSVAIRKGK